MFSGQCDVMAGSLSLNLNNTVNINSSGGISESDPTVNTRLLSERIQTLHLLFQKLVAGNNREGPNISLTSSLGNKGEDILPVTVVGTSPPMYLDDLVVLERNSRRYLSLDDMCNKNALQLAQWLSHHPAIKRVYYPNFSPEPLNHDEVEEKRGGQLPVSIRKPVISYDLVPPIAAEPYGGDDPKCEVLHTETRGEGEQGERMCHMPGAGCLLSLTLHPDKANVQVRLLLIIDFLVQYAIGRENKESQCCNKVCLTHPKI